MLEGDMTAGGNLSENLARYRKARDMSQHELAEAAGVGIDTVARIEQGVRQTTRPATLNKLAAALGVSVERLLGQAGPVPPAQIDIATLRQAITAGDDIPGLEDFAESREVVDLDELAKAAHRAWRAYVDGRHGELSHMLPVVLADARRLVRSTTGDEKARAHRALSTAYRLGAGMAGRAGFDDLAWTSAEHALDAARRSDAPELETAISLRYLAWTLVRQGRFEDAERVAVTAAERVQPAMLDRDPARAGVFGNLLFNAASAALSAGSPSRAADLLAEAQAAALRSRGDTATEAAIFGPRVATLQRIDQTARAGDPEKALRLAATIPTARGEVPAFWEAGHRLRLAAVSLELRRYSEVLHYLIEAKELAPDWVRYQPLGMATMRNIVDRAPRRRGAEFAQLAAHFGIVDPTE
ncbi:helix-turn-helix domain-containing protein [Amycolatopsis cynarae]|uniref:Helix-turn-helix domain-containing protein n=1 Tax=Amycolatopsis cynarae TaxID=2995223 RepID=A0ABY7B405_9PSEU|nr:helix-turn-helix domain-containing protein [Amycolatopsis sp. HUAS 11-8]WAL65962.1 helix-turn-helix domain-containing protein [Amycolatopsis sp. HUAS 11-8]